MIKADVSVGIMAHNEAGNIARLLRAILRQNMGCCRLTETIVVASGCTDKTEEIVGDIIKKDQRIRLMVQPRREGKASAINLFLSAASGDILILESGDTVPERDAFGRLLAPFVDPRTGMTGARPIPVNGQNGTFMGFTVNLLWSLHHSISLLQPKLGELVAFRGVVSEIPGDTAVDEAAIEALIKKAGYTTCYVPNAVVRNKGPENIRDFVRQRRRIAAGHRHLLRKEGYRVSTLSAKVILKTLIRQHSWGVKETIWTLGAISLEAAARALGHFDYCILGKNPFVWEVATSTKKWEMNA